MEKSQVWEYFIKKSVDAATCKLCSKIISCKGKSTSGLLRHLKGIHKKESDSVHQQEEPPEKVRKPSQHYITILVIKWKIWVKLFQSLLPLTDCP